LHPRTAATIALLALAASPGLAAAQAWPATTTSGSRTGVPIVSPTLRMTPARATAQAPARPVLHLRRVPQAVLPPTQMTTASAERFELRPKDEWFDDQGLRFTAGRLAVKQRF
jgi:hypothetical protein